MVGSLNGVRLRVAQGTVGYGALLQSVARLGDRGAVVSDAIYGHEFSLQGLSGKVPALFDREYLMFIIIVVES